MIKPSVNNQPTEIHNTFASISKKLPSRQITSELKEEIKKFKSEIADGVLPLIMGSNKTSQFSYSDDQDTYYCIDLRATSYFVPPRLEGKPKRIDETTRIYRTIHEEEIEHGNIACYKATDDGKLVAFKSRPSSHGAQAIQALRFAHQLFNFNFPELKPQKFSTYNVKCCAHPYCGAKLEKEEDHLQLCPVHNKKLAYSIEHQWLPAGSEKIYTEIKNVGTHDSEGLHDRIYFTLLPQLNTWIEQIDRLIPTDCTGIGTQTSSIESWLVLHLRPVRQLLILMKSAIFLYRMHLNPFPDGLIIAALIALIVHGLQSEVTEGAMIRGYVRIIRTICGVYASIFAYLGIGVLYTLDLIFTDDAYIAILLKTFGVGLVAAGVAAVVIITTPVAIFGGIAAATVGSAMFFIGDRMGKERNNRGTPHPHLIQVHLDLRIARERLWQWIEDDDA